MAAMPGTTMWQGANSYTAQRSPNKVINFRPNRGRTLGERQRAGEFNPRPAPTGQGTWNPTGGVRAPLPTYGGTPWTKPDYTSPYSTPQAQPQGAQSGDVFANQPLPDWYNQIGNAPQFSGQQGWAQRGGGPLQVGPAQQRGGGPLQVGLAQQTGTGQFQDKYGNTLTSYAGTFGQGQQRGGGPLQVGPAQPQRGSFGGTPPGGRPPLQTRMQSDNTGLLQRRRDYINTGGAPPPMTPQAQQWMQQQQAPPGQPLPNPWAPVYSQSQTQHGINQSRAHADQGSNLNWGMQQMARPGMSTPGNAGRAMFEIANRRAAGEQDAGNMVIGHNAANARQGLEWQKLRAGKNLSGRETQRRIAAMNSQYGLANQGLMMNALL